uniref:Uncharacterized protein n=1 Tax=Plectus sambesii TaxID=2011161 RepID=A0A914W4V1_9BILA
MLQSLVTVAIALIAFSASASIPLPKLENQLAQNSPISKDDGMCKWFGSAPLCDGQCVWPYTVQQGESETGDSDQKCVSGHKVYCCKEYIGEGSNCKWFGTAPLCQGECAAPYTHQVNSSSSGDGQTCWTGQKVFCCY